MIPTPVVRQDENTLVAEEPEAFDDADELAQPPRPRRRRWWQKALIGLGVTVLVLVVAGVSLFEFGGMSRSAYDPAIGQAYASMAATGQARPIQHRFVIPIPGCVCHSQDPVQTEAHRNYRMSECGRCHGGTSNSAQNVQ